MRSAMLQLPDARTANEQRHVLRAAIRQLERAELYLAAVEYMDLEDQAARRVDLMLDCGDREGQFVRRRIKRAIEHLQAAPSAKPN